MCAGGVLLADVVAGGSPSGPRPGAGPVTYHSGRATTACAAKGSEGAGSGAARGRAGAASGSAGRANKAGAASGAPRSVLRGTGGRAGPAG